MTDIADLITRLESATEGSRELDAEISVGIGNPDHEDAQSCRTCMCAPRYTASVDAALTLLRPDDWLKLNHRWVDEKFGGTKECFAGIEYSEAPFFSGGRSATFPLAICLATLRSRLPIQTVT